MFVQTWNKYLPVIRILLKRGVHTEQTLDMNQSDFERAAGGKKVKFTFSIVLESGRLRRAETLPQLAKDFIAVLQQDDVAYKFLRQHVLEFTMNNSFQLHIKNTVTAEPDGQVDEELTVTDPPDSPDASEQSDN